MVHDVNSIGTFSLTQGKLWLLQFWNFQSLYRIDITFCTRCTFLDTFSTCFKFDFEFHHCCMYYIWGAIYGHISIKRCSFGIYLWCVLWFGQQLWGMGILEQCLFCVVLTIWEYFWEKNLTLVNIFLPFIANPMFSPESLEYQELSDRSLSKREPLWELNRQLIPLWWNWRRRRVSQINLLLIMGRCRIILGRIGN